MYHLVEPRILEILERQQGITDTRLIKYHKLDSDMQSLVTDDRPTTTDDETVKVYNQNLMRQRMMQDQYANHRSSVKWKWCKLPTWLPTLLATTGVPTRLSIRFPTPIPRDRLKTTRNEKSTPAYPSPGKEKRNS